MKNIKNSTFLITGGTGSFGSTMVRKLLKLKAGKIIIFSRDEKKQFDLRNELNSTKVDFFIGDVRDEKSIDSALSRSVDYVFHSAALKQVPSCEFFPTEAFKTNVNGAYNVIKQSIKNKIKKVVLLSTDKAVYPINTMGLTKSLMEKMMIAESKNSNTTLCATRYGNVMGTRGSIIPLLSSQIDNENYITITNEKMTRFLMSIEESIDLVLHAFDKAKSGEIFIHKAPSTTVKILVEAIQVLKKKKKKIKIIGIRGGEKMHETLISKEELLRTKNFRKYFLIPPETKNFDYESYFKSGKIFSTYDEYNSENTEKLNLKQTVEKLKSSALVRKVISGNVI